MNLIKKIYLQLYLFCFALYLIFNKGVAYTYFVEILWFLGILLIVLNRNNYILLLNSKLKFLIIFLIIVTVNLIIYIFKYPLNLVVRDSFIIFYAAFVFILMLFQEERLYIWKILSKFYLFFPFIVVINFLLQSYATALENLVIFGNVPILLYKYGDMGVHLLISTLFFINNFRTLPKFKRFFYTSLIILDFLIIISYSRSGMLSFLLGLFVYIFFSNFKFYFNIRILRNIVISMFIVLPILLFIDVKDNFQGRTVGVSQISQNLESVVGNIDNETLENNEIWRLIWWGKIIQYSFTVDNFFIGRGLGMSLSQTDDIDAYEDLRSPHNYHLTLMARFGVIFFIFWIFWIYLILNPLFKRKLFDKSSFISSILLAFLVNATFDVYLEGPMGAFPFWTFVGLLIIEEYYYKPNEIPI